MTAGTSAHAILAAVDADGVEFALPAAGGGSRARERFSAVDCSTYTDALMRYAAAHAVTLRGCRLFMSVAGAVNAGTIRTTNGRWFISVSGLTAMTGVEPVILNDVTALAWATLDDRPPTPFGQAGLRSIAAVGRHVVAWAGTNGVGAACVDRRDDRLTIIDSEAGHTAFCPQDDEQWGLAARLRQGHGDASFEGAVIDVAAQQGERGRESVDRLLARLLGSYCGNVTLTFAAWDGVYLCGPLFERLARSGTASTFRASFEGRGKMRALLRQVPTWTMPASDNALTGLGRLFDRQVAA